MNEQSDPQPTLPRLKGHALIADEVKRLDGSPGVYRMLGDKGQVLYVGKARNLKKRVSNYAKPTGHTARIARMISQTCEMIDGRPFVSEAGFCG